MGLMVNALAGALLALTIAFYIGVYTVWLKRRTPQNIVIGGLAGALPPLIGWVAVTGAVAWLPMVLVAMIFVWTPPHFWALALYRRGDYAKAGVPMLPVVAGERATRRHILVYASVLYPLTLLPWALGPAGPVYGWVAGLLGALFVAGAVQVWRAPAGQFGSARALFGYSILYLFALFAALLADVWMGGLG